MIRVLKPRARTRILFLSVFLFFFQLSPSRADSPSLVFFPSVFTVGDRVEMRVERDDPGVDTSISVKDKNEFPDIDSLEILEVTRKRKNGRSLDVCLFIPWVSGDISVPAFSVKEIPFPQTILKVSSVLSGTDREMRPLRPPRALRGTAAVLGTMAVLLLLCAGVFCLWFAWFMPAFARRRALKRARMPATAFLRSLKRLQRRGDSASCAEFYRVLSRSSLDYLDSVFPVPVSGLTASEFGLSSGLFSKTVPRAEGYAAILVRAEAVRFARRDIDRETMESDLAFLLESAALALEAMSVPAPFPAAAVKTSRISDVGEGTPC